MSSNIRFAVQDRTFRRATSSARRNQRLVRRTTFGLWFATQLLTTKLPWHPPTTNRCHSRNLPGFKCGTMLGAVAEPLCGTNDRKCYSGRDYAGAARRLALVDIGLSGGWLHKPGNRRPGIAVVSSELSLRSESVFLRRLDLLRRSLHRHALLEAVSFAAWAASRGDRHGSGKLRSQGHTVEQPGRVVPDSCHDLTRSSACHPTEIEALWEHPVLRRRNSADVSNSCAMGIAGGWSRAVGANLPAGAAHGLLPGLGPAKPDRPLGIGSVVQFSAYLHRLRIVYCAGHPRHHCCRVLSRATDGK